MIRNYNVLGGCRDTILENEKGIGINLPPEKSEVGKKSWLLSVFVLFCMIFTGFTASAQVTVTATGVGPGPTVYTTVKLAFDAINAGTHQGAITISLTASTTETASAVLNSGEVAPASYSSVGITATVPVTVSGAIVGAVIKLNGADNVTIDGRIGGSGRNITVQNTSTSAATAAVWLASVVAGNGCVGNTIRNLELLGGTDPVISTNSTYGIIMCGITISTTANGTDNDNNTFTQNRITKVRYGIVTRGTTTNLNEVVTVTNNIVGPTAFGSDEIGKVGIFMQADNLAVVSGNTVQFVGGQFANNSGGSDRVGIGIGSESWSMTPGTITSTNYTVTNNIIHDVIEERTFSAVGLQLATTNGGAATNNLVANNIIYNVRANGTAGDFCVGLGIAGGFGDTVANNSISMTGDVDPNASASATTMFGSGIRVANVNGTTHNNLTLVNNSVYMDLSSSSTPAARYYAISGNSAAYSFGTGKENNNNYYINPVNTQVVTGGLGTVSGLTFTTQFATLLNWQAAYTVPQDSNSIQANPNYASTTADLHINATSANIDAGTSVAAVTTDFDGEARPNGANYDIGADEYYALPGSLQFSSATYASNENLTLTVTVTRTGGSAGIVGASYTFANVTATGGATCGVGTDYTNTGGTVSLADGVTSATFNVSICGDLIVDASETFTIALSAPTGGASLGSPSSTTVTIGDVPPPLSGTYTVGSGGNYPSLTNNDGIFAAINLSGATSNLTINIISDLPSELGTHALNQVSGGFTVLIKPSGGPRTITGSNTGSLIRLNDADGVTIDGSTTGANVAACLVGGNAALRELTIQNTSTATTACVLLVATAVNGAQNNTIKNVNVLGIDPLTTLVGISLGGATAGTTGTDNDGNSVVNCAIRRATLGIYSAGVSTANQNLGTVIRQNDLTGTTTERIRRVGVMVFNDDNLQVTRNSIGGILSSEGADAIGIALGTQDVNATNVTVGSITNATINGNKIDGVANDNTWSAAGIAFAGGITGPSTISNNMISGVISDSNAGDITAGIFVIGGTGTNTKVYYNTVSMTGDRSALLTPATTMYPSYALAISGVDTVIEVKNNILHTSQFATTGGVNAISYAIGMSTSTFVNLDSNYNAFWSEGANDGGFRTANLGVTTPTNYATLALWSAAVSDDVNSIESLPTFVGVSDLHLDIASSAAFNSAATPVAVTTDYDCETRSATPDIGADEFIFLGCTGANGGDASGDVTNCGPITSPSITASGYSVGTGSTYQWMSSTNLGDYPLSGTAVGGQTNPSTLTAGLISSTSYYWLRVTCTSGTALDYSSLVTITITPIPAEPTGLECWETATLNTGTCTWVVTGTQPTEPTVVNTILLSEGFDDITTLPGAGWSQINTSLPLGSSSWFQGNAVLTQQSGAATSWIGANFNNVTGDNTISNWLITPQTTLQNGDVIKFWTRTVSAVAFPDRLQVRLSTTGAGTDPVGPTDLGSYTTLLLDINPTYTLTGYPSAYTEYSLTVSGLSGPTASRVALRYFVTNGGPSGANSDFIGIDTFSITTTTPLACNESYEFNNETCAWELVTGPPCESIVNLTLFIEGYYRADDDAMTTVQNNQDAPDYLLPPNTNVEQITVELRDPVTTLVVDTATPMLQTDGTALCSFPTAPNGSYYIAVKTRSTVQTWSKLPQPVGPVALDYDFTTAASQAFLDNQVLLETGVYGFFSGDIDSNGAQDDEVGPSDYSEWEADANALLFGSYPTDLNGDGEVGPTDYSIWETNANNFVFAYYPPAP